MKTALETKKYQYEEDGIIYDIIENDIGKFWLLNNLTHRLSGPAIEFSSGATYWYFEGKRHRLTGPAVVDDGRIEWFYKGEPINCSSQEEFEKLLKLKAFW